MLSLIALALAASTSSPTLDASAAWWERVTMTVDESGAQRSCTYESSISPSPSEGCEAQPAARSQKAASGPEGVYSKLTFERRFSPGPRPNSVRLRPGDKLLAQRVMFLTIDADGSVQACRVVAESGDSRPDYGCEGARAERFRVLANAAGEPTRQAFMTILIYGHVEQIA